MSTLRLTLAIIVALSMAGGVNAEADTQTKAACNPSPSPDDLILPMPGGLEMAFRKIVVPGKDFWYDPEREITLGDASAGADDPFSNERRVRVMGSFKDDDYWWYPIGKYEVSKAQFAAVMGDGDINAGLAQLSKLSGDSADTAIAELQGRDRELRLAEPVRWIGWHAVNDFIHRYNTWLFADPKRTSALPQLAWSLGGKSAMSPGFLRLPSEIEWEYAARGGVETIRQGQGIFERPLPFDRAEFEAYAWLSENAKSKVKPIGQRKPTFGLHDMLGNVAELVVDPFRPELELGKVGGLAVRGGSVQTSMRQVRLGLRAEQPLYQEDLNAPGRMMEARSPFVGFRLAIGVLVYPDTQYRRQLVESFQVYAAGFRNNTQIASGGTASAIIQSSIPIGELKERVSRLGSDKADLRLEAQHMVAKLGQIEQLQDQEIRKVVFDLLDNTIWVAAEFGRNYFRWRERRDVALPAAERLAKISTQYQEDYEELIRNAEKYERLGDQNFNKYVYFVKRMAEYGPRYIEEAIARGVKREYLPIERDALDLIKTHVNATQQGKTEIESWREHLIKNLAQKNKV